MRVVALALVVVGAAACRFRVDSASGDLAIAGDASMMEQNDLASGDDLAVPSDLAMPDLLVPGILSGARVDTPTTVNLSAEGVTDWAHFGLNTVSDVNRKSGGPAAVTLTAAVGTPGQWPYYAPSLSWTGGTPTASATTTSGLYMYGVNSSFAVTVPADTKMRTLRIYLSQYKSTASLLAHLSDGSASDFTMSTSIGGTNVYHCYTISFRASLPGQTLRVTWTMTADSGSGTVDLMAATYY